MHVHCAIKNLIFSYYKMLLQLHLISAATTLVQGLGVPYPAAGDRPTTSHLDLGGALRFSLHLVEALVLVSATHGGSSRTI